jgi:hypothetical protein
MLGGSAALSNRIDQSGPWYLVAFQMEHRALEGLGDTPDRRTPNFVFCFSTTSIFTLIYNIFLPHLKAIIDRDELKKTTTTRVAMPNEARLAVNLKLFTYKYLFAMKSTKDCPLKKKTIEFAYNNSVACRSQNQRSRD